MMLQPPSIRFRPIQVKYKHDPHPSRDQSTPSPYLSSLQMASKCSQPHFVLLPFLGQGHLIPMVDIGRTLAQRGTMVTIVTTPTNAARFKPIIDTASESGLQIQLLQILLKGSEAGLPDGCENTYTLPSKLKINFFAAVRSLQEPFERLLQNFGDPPSCIIADVYMTWAVNTAMKFNIPRIQFDGTSCFNLLCSHILQTTKVYEQVAEGEHFVIPGLPHQLEFTRMQLPATFHAGQTDLKGMLEEITAAEKTAFGVVVNSFEELEPTYAEHCRKLKGNKVWCIGPVSLCNLEESDVAGRGNKASIDQNQCSKWLDAWPASSVVYASLGSVSHLTPPQLIELGLGLEASNRPFIWVIRVNEKTEDLKKWALEEGFEERVKDRGLVIWGWAPQVLILSHPAVGGFLTHCGWNSTLEGVCAGVPMVTWPLFAEQFFNEKVVVDIMRVGVRVGVAVGVRWGEEEKTGVMVGKEDVKKAVTELMEEGGEEGRKRRRRVEELQGKAKRAMEQGGSSFLNVGLLIEDIMKFNSHAQAEIIYE